jgi:hypothetical protein
MITELFFFAIIMGLFYIIYVKTIGEKRKYDKKLTVYKDVGGQAVKEVEFMVKEELLPVDPDDTSNCAWFLVTKKVKGRQLIWPRPPYENWISDNHCQLYSRSYKGNNYACLIDTVPFIEKIKKVIGKDEKEEKVEYGMLDSHGKVELAKWVCVENPKGEQELALVDVGTEYRSVVFAKDNHKIKAIFDERNLPEMVSLHTAMNQMFAFEGWWDKNWQKVLIMAIVGIVVISGILNYKMFNEATEGVIQHDLTVHVEGSAVTYEETTTGDGVEQPPDTPPPGGIFGDFLKNR